MGELIVWAIIITLAIQAIRVYGDEIINPKKTKPPDPTDWRTKEFKDYTEEDWEKFKAERDRIVNTPAHKCYSRKPLRGHKCPKCGKHLKTKTGQYGCYEKCESCGYAYWE